MGALAEEAHEVGALLIFDEIQTARLSTGGRQALLGIKPDLTTLGKFHGGGLSFEHSAEARSCVAVRPAKPAALSHAGFNNNVLSMAAGHPGLSRVLTAETLDALNGRGDRSARGSTSSLPGSMRDRAHGSRLAHELSLHGRPGPRAQGSFAAVFDLLERGYYIAPRGFIALSLPVDDATPDGFVDAVREVMMSRAALFCGR